jgi:hypothetical protein
MGIFSGSAQDLRIHEWRVTRHRLHRWAKLSLHGMIDRRLSSLYIKKRFVDDAEVLFFLPSALFFSLPKFVPTNVQLFYKSLRGAANF